MAATNQAGTKVGLPERVPMGPAGGVWLGSAGNRLKADLVVCSGVGPLGSRRAAMPVRQAVAAHLAPYGRAGAEAAWARCCIVGQWMDAGCTNRPGYTATMARHKPYGGGHNVVCPGQVEQCCSTGWSPAQGYVVYGTVLAAGRTWLGSRGVRRRGVHDARRGSDSDDALTRTNKRVAKSTAQLAQCATRGKAAYCACVERHVILRAWPCRRASAVSEGGATGDTLTTFNPFNYI